MRLGVSRLAFLPCFGSGGSRQSLHLLAALEVWHVFPLSSIHPGVDADAGLVAADADTPLRDTHFFDSYSMI